MLGQSQSAGWSATLPGGRSLGPSQLIDGYANGWYVPAGLVTGPTVIHLTWTPQRVVWAAIGVSAVALVAAISVALWPAAVTSVGRASKAPGPVAVEVSGTAAGGGRAGSGPLPVSWAAVGGLAGRRARPLPLAAAATGWAVPLGW